MKAKLIKMLLHDVYRLDDEKGELIALTLESSKSKLSLKNCQAIERGYYLDDCVDYFEKGKLYIQQDGVIILAGENGNNGIIIKDPLETRGVGHYSDEWNPKAFCEFKQKAIELIGDKEFNEQDMKFIFACGRNYQITADTDCNFYNAIQSLKQTEWDVEVEMVPAMSNNGNVYYGDIPKLDADGCLILKRID